MLTADKQNISCKQRIQNKAGNEPLTCTDQDCSIGAKFIITSTPHLIDPKLILKAWLSKCISLKTSHCSIYHSQFCVLKMVVFKFTYTIEYLIYRLQLRQVETAKKLRLWFREKDSENNWVG